MEGRFFYNIPKLHEIKTYKDPELLRKWNDFVEERRKILASMDKVVDLYDDLIESIPKEKDMKNTCNFFIGEGGGNRCRRSCGTQGRCSRHAVRVESRYPALCQNIRDGSKCLYELDEKKYCELCKNTDGHCHKIIRTRHRWFRCPNRLVDGKCNHENSTGLCQNIIRMGKRKGKLYPVRCNMELQNEQCPICHGHNIPKPWWWVDTV